MAKKLTFLYLSEPDVIKTNISLKESVEICTQSFREHGLKEVDNPAKLALHPDPDSFLHAMPAWLKQLKQAGLKWVAGFPGNMKQRLPTVAGIIVINDLDTGFPSAIMDGTYITALRTAAASGVAVKCLARQDSEVLGIVGTGVQGKYNALLLMHLLPTIKKIQIYDTYTPSMDSFVAQISPHIDKDKVTIEIKNSVEEAVTGADVIVTATAKLHEPIFFDKWVKQGALVLPIHSAGWNKDILVKMDKVVVDDWEQFTAFTKGKVYDPFLSAPYAELGEIVAGKKPGRENNTERIVNFNVGLAIHDVVMATRVLEKAKKMGVGTELDFIDLSAPIPLPPIQ